MNIPYYTLAQKRLGKPGMVGVGLLVFSLAFYLGGLAPVRAELKNLQGQQAQLLAESDQDRRQHLEPNLKAPSPPTLPVSEMPNVLNSLNSLAKKHGVIVERASFQSTTLATQDGQHRLEVTLPLRSSYPALRAYLHDALALNPAARLDDLRLNRQQADSPVIQANVRLSYYFAPAP